MPPKMSFKPKMTASARSRKKVVAADAGSDNDDVHMDDGAAANQDDNILEDPVQEAERLEEERLQKEKLVSRDNRMDIDHVLEFASASGSSESQVKEAVANKAKAANFSLEDEFSDDGRQGSIDRDNYDDEQDDVSMEPEGEKEPDYADEGDELIKEIPVYLSQQLAKHLYLFQYPVRAAALPYTQGSGPSKARIKPLSQLIELELPVDTKAKNYNRERGEELALGMNDKALRTALDGELDDDEEREMLDKQTLVSTLIPSATNYLAGVLRNDTMHLTPFHGAVQLRPSFKYLDKIDEKHKQASKKVNDEENKELIAKQKAEQEQKAKALQVQVRSAADSEQRRTTGPNKARLAEEENWTKLDYFDAETIEADFIYERMFAKHMDDLECATTVQDYLGLVSSNNSLSNVKTEHA